MLRLFFVCLLLYPIPASSQSFEEVAAFIIDENEDGSASIVLKDKMFSKIIEKKPILSFVRKGNTYTFYYTYDDIGNCKIRRTLKVEGGEFDINPSSKPSVRVFDFSKNRSLELIDSFMKPTYIYRGLSCREGDGSLCSLEDEENINEERDFEFYSSIPYARLSGAVSYIKGNFCPGAAY